MRFKPGSGPVDYLASQLLFLQRRLSLPPGERWDTASTTAEQDTGIKAMGLETFSDDFARAMFEQIIIQLRTIPIGLRVDDWIREHLPGLRSQQDGEMRSQLAEMHRVLAPEIRSKFPKRIVDANTAMNAAFAGHWAKADGDPRHTIAFMALGYRGQVDKLLGVLAAAPEDPTGDLTLVAEWAEILGLTGAFHFQTSTP